MEKIFRDSIVNSDSLNAFCSQNKLNVKKFNKYHTCSNHNNYAKYNILKLFFISLFILNIESTSFANRCEAVFKSIQSNVNADTLVRGKSESSNNRTDNNLSAKNLTDNKLSGNKLLGNYLSDKNQTDNKLSEQKLSDNNQSVIKNPFWTQKFNFFNKTPPSFKQLGIEATNPQWERLQFPDTPDKNEYAKLYVKNITESLQIFAKGFEENEITQLESFTSILQTQNKIAVVGSHSDQPYGGYFLGSDWTAGVDVLIKMAWKIGEPIPDRDELILDEKNTLYKNAGFFRKYGIGIELSDFLYGPDIQKREIIKTMIEPIIQIPTLPLNALPQNRFESNYNWMHEYPEVEYFDQYLKRMHNIILQIKTCEGCSRLQIIDLLADYYHTGINAHFFNRVNHSLLMSQVNYILKRIGLQGMIHASLPPLKLRIDGAAIIMSSTKFKEFFESEVIAQHELALKSN